MHRSRPLMLAVVVAAVAGCSAQKDPQDAKALSKDSALIARMDDYQKADKRNEKSAFPDACGTFTIPSPTPAAKSQARVIARQADTAEMLGNMREASSLFRRASELDGTNKSAAYHLGRVSEALNDRSTAINAYCRYLALAPTSAEAVEARQRVLNLTQPNAQLAAAPTSHATRKKPVVEAHRVVLGAGVDHSSHIVEPKRAMHSTTTVASGAIDVPVQTNPVTQPDAEPRVSTVPAQSDGVEATPALPALPQPRADGRGPSRAQTAGIGAVAGAILGGVTGRSVKAAAIGAAAGGVLGAALPRGTRGPS